MDDTYISFVNTEVQTCIRVIPPILSAQIHGLCNTLSIRHDNHGATQEILGEGGMSHREVKERRLLLSGNSSPPRATKKADDS